MKYQKLLTLIRQELRNKKHRKELMDFLKFEKPDLSKLNSSKAKEIYNNASVIVLNKLFSMGLDINLNKSEILKSALRYEQSTYANYLRIAELSGQEIVYPKNIDYSLAGDIKYLNIQKVKYLFSLKNYPQDLNDYTNYVGCIGDRYREGSKTINFQKFFDKVCPDEYFITYFLEEMGWHFKSVEESFVKELYKRRNKIDLKNISEDKKEDLKEKLLSSYREISIPLLYKFINLNIFTKKDLENRFIGKLNPSKVDERTLQFLKDKKLNILPNLDDLKINYESVITLLQTGNISLFSEKNWEDIYKYFENNSFTKEQYDEMFNLFLGNETNSLYYCYENYYNLNVILNTKYKNKIEKLYEVIFLTENGITYLKKDNWTFKKYNSKLEKDIAEKPLNFVSTQEVLYFDYSKSKENSIKKEEFLKNYFSLYVKAIFKDKSTVSSTPYVYLMKNLEFVRYFLKNEVTFEYLGKYIQEEIFNSYFDMESKDKDDYYKPYVDFIKNNELFIDLKNYFEKKYELTKDVKIIESMINEVTDENLHVILEKSEDLLIKIEELLTKINKENIFIKKIFKEIGITYFNKSEIKNFYNNPHLLNIIKKLQSFYKTEEFNWEIYLNDLFNNLENRWYQQIRKTIEEDFNFFNELKNEYTNNKLFKEVFDYELFFSYVLNKEQSIEQQLSLVSCLKTQKFNDFIVSMFIDKINPHQELLDNLFGKLEIYDLSIKTQAKIQNLYYQLNNNTNIDMIANFISNQIVEKNKERNNDYFNIHEIFEKEKWLDISILNVLLDKKLFNSEITKKINYFIKNKELHEKIFPNGTMYLENLKRYDNFYTIICNYSTLKEENKNFNKIISIINPGIENMDLFSVIKKTLVDEYLINEDYKWSIFETDKEKFFSEFFQLLNDFIKQEKEVIIADKRFVFELLYLLNVLWSDINREIKYNFIYQLSKIVNSNVYEQIISFRNEKKEEISFIFDLVVIPFTYASITFKEDIEKIKLFNDKLNEFKKYLIDNYETELLKELKKEEIDKMQLTLDESEESDKLFFDNVLCTLEEILKFNNNMN